MKWTLVDTNKSFKLWFDNRAKEFSIWNGGTLIQKLTQTTELEAKQFFKSFKDKPVDAFATYNFTKHVYDFDDIVMTNNIETVDICDRSSYPSTPTSNQLGFCYFNPNPRNCIVGDCVKRAIVVATGIDYHELEVFMNQNKVKKNLAYNYPVNYANVCCLLGGRRIKMNVPKGTSRWHVTTINQVMHNYPHLSYVLEVSKHLIGVRNERIFDLFDDRPRDKGIYKMYVFGATQKELDEIQAKCSKGNTRFTL